MTRKKGQYFIIGGGGRVGYFLARALLEADADYEVVLLERDEGRAKMLKRELGDVVVRGDACEVATLEHVGCERADFLLAVTGEDEDNLVMCQVAKQGFRGNRRTIARVNNSANIKLFYDLGIDIVVSPTNDILKTVGEELPLWRVIDITPPSNGGLRLVEVRVPENAPILGKTISAMGLPPDNTITLLVRDKHNSVPTPQTTLQAADKLFALVSDEGKLRLERAILGEHTAARLIGVIEED
ncbi:MAG: TrkA family potassium uptake protein [Ktedonobacterales bacterium]|nr:TrkA family potassium uptake protein [Ktedonobacterales bacterium]